MKDASETGSLLVALARTVLSIGAGALVASGQRIVGTLAACLSVVLLLTTSLAFLTVSGYRAILASLGPIYAPLIVGCLYLVAGLVAALVILLRRR